jgi:Domain of unknown function (DUF4189)
MTMSTHRRRFALAVAAMTTAAATTVALAPTAGADDNWGAIAYAHSGAWGRSWDYPTAAAAQATAMNSCYYSDCSVLTTFTGCGAVARNAWKFQGGNGPNLSAAMHDALARIGRGWIDSWVCN